jgi:2-polyprenyl-6-hydroxyphenyl methylase/3-demethylubiquinone-9 3-methyltransferase
MAINNQWYDDLGDRWWSADGPVALLHEIKPALFDYFKSALGEVEGLKLLDVGCGGGLLAELFAASGANVTGVDLSHSSLVAALRHGDARSLSIKYVNATGERLPFANSHFDAVVAADFLEHVSGLDSVISECARVLKPSGRFLYDTINRTFSSRLVAIFLFERVLRVIPKNTHDARLFIKPLELHRVMERHGLENRETRGLVPERGLLASFASLIKKRTVGPFMTGRNHSISYVGYAVKGK